MPISAKVNDNVMVAPLLGDEEWDVLCRLHEIGKVKIATQCCNMPAAPMKTRYGSRFFQAPACKHFAEDNHTINIQSLIAKALQAKGWSVAGSLPDAGLDGKTSFRVDVMGTSPDAKRKIGFAVYPGEPGGDGSLTKVMTNLTRARSAGIDLISLFPSLPASGVWGFVRAGKIVPSAVYSRNPLMVMGLPPHEYVSLALKKPAVVQKKGLKPSLKICTYAAPIDGESDVICGFRVLYNDDEIWTGNWKSGWSHLDRIDLNRKVGGKKKTYAASMVNEIKQQNLKVDNPLLCSEMVALSTVISHLFPPDGRLSQFREVTSHLVLAPSGNPDMRDVVSDLLAGGFGRRYATEYPRFFHVTKQYVQELRQKKTYVIAMSSTPTESPRYDPESTDYGPMVLPAEITAMASGPESNQEIDLRAASP